MTPPYTPRQVLATLAIWDTQLHAHPPNLTSGPGYVRHGIQDMLRRGIDTPRREIDDALADACLLCGVEFDASDPRKTIAKLTVAIESKR